MARELPLFAGEIGDLTGEIRDILAALVDEQLAYHVANAERLERRDHIYEGIGVGLLAASLVNNAVYLVVRIFDASGLESYESWGLAAAIFLPAAATAAYGVRLFGDYEDLARRSRRTAGELRALQARIVGALDLPRVARRRRSGDAGDAVRPRRVAGGGGEPSPVGELRPRATPPPALRRAAAARPCGSNAGAG